MTTIGYLGLGAMGGALSAHLAASHDLVVIDRNPAAVQALVAQGASTVATAADLARICDIILLCLPRTADVRDALFAPGGMAEGLRPGTLVIDQTSGNPGQTAAIAAQLALRDVTLMDAPVSGGIPAAQAGRVTIIASGPDAAWRQAEPVLRAMTDKVFHCSTRVGDGQALKLVNNAIGAGYRMATLELVALGRAAGLPLAPLVDALNSGPAANFTSRNMLAGLVAGQSTTNFALSLMVKDLNEALALGVLTGSALPVTAGARSLMQMGLHLLGPAARLDDVIPFTERLAGVALASGAAADEGDMAVQDLILRGMMVCNLLAVAECIAMGRRFGLDGGQMARILNVGSAWSMVSDVILPAMAAGRPADVDLTLGQAADTLAALATLAAGHAVPLLIPQTVLAFVQDAARQHGRQASLGVLTFGYDAG